MDLAARRMANGSILIIRWPAGVGITSPNAVSRTRAKSLFAIVFQMGRRKPMLKKPLGEHR